MKKFVAVFWTTPKTWSIILTKDVFEGDIEPGSIAYAKYKGKSNEIRILKLSDLYSELKALQVSSDGTINEDDSEEEGEDEDDVPLKALKEGCRPQSSRDKESTTAKAVSAPKSNSKSSSKPLMKQAVYSVASEPQHSHDTEAAEGDVEETSTRRIRGKNQRTTNVGCKMAARVDPSPQEAAEGDVEATSTRQIRGKNQRSTSVGCKMAARVDPSPQGAADLNTEPTANRLIKKNSQQLKSLDCELAAGVESSPKGSGVKRGSIPSGTTESKKSTSAPGLRSNFKPSTSALSKVQDATNTNSSYQEAPSGSSPTRNHIQQQPSNTHVAVGARSESVTPTSISNLARSKANSMPAASPETILFLRNFADWLEAGSGARCNTPTSPFLQSFPSVLSSCKSSGDDYVPLNMSYPDVKVSRTLKTNLTRKYKEKPHSLFRSLLQALVPPEKLKEMCARGGDPNEDRPCVPAQMMSAIEGHVNNFAKTPLLDAQITKLVNNLCFRLRKEDGKDKESFEEREGNSSKKPKRKNEEGKGKERNERSGTGKEHKTNGTSAGRGRRNGEEKGTQRRAHTSPKVPARLVSSPLSSRSAASTPRKSPALQWKVQNADYSASKFEDCYQGTVPPSNVRRNLTEEMHSPSAQNVASQAFPLQPVNLSLQGGLISQSYDILNL